MASPIPPADPFLQKIKRLNSSSPKFHDDLNEILHKQSYEDCVKTLKQEDVEWLINFLDQILGILDPVHSAARKCRRELKTLCRKNGMLPSSCNFSRGAHPTVPPYYSASGGFGDVYKGALGSKVVCIKRLRLPKEDLLPEIQKALCEEAVMWKHLKHENLVSFFGATTYPPQLVSEWVSDGDLLSYVEKNPNANRIALLTEVADGLSYLHSREVIHGDVKSINILVQVVGNKPHARITDFGIAIVTQNVHSIRAPTAQKTHTTMYSAPEILSGTNPSHQSDVYSFGMVIFAILAGEDPFKDETIYVAAVGIMGGRRPKRPTHPTCVDHIWALIQSCWNHEPSLRPKMPSVLGKLQHS